MKTITVKTQKDIESVTTVAADEELIIEAEVRLSHIIDISGKLVVRAKVECSWYDNRYFRVHSQATIYNRANSQATIYNRENSQATIENWANSQATIYNRANSQATIENWENSQATIYNRENSQATIYNWENSQATIENWENSQATIYNRANSQATIENWANSQATIYNRENSQATIYNRANSQATIYNRENSQATIYNWENSFCRVLKDNDRLKITNYAFSVCFLGVGVAVKVTKKSKTTLVQKAEPLDFFERHGIEKTPKVILYKRVSKDYKTQESKPWETLWQIGAVVTHPNWNPTESECGSGKFHACPRPFFCDDFREGEEDKYIAVEIALDDLYEWKDSPEYPHKIGFREGRVLYECNRKGEKIEGQDV